MKPGWIELFADNAAKNAAESLSDPEKFLIESYKICELLLEYISDHRLPESEWNKTWPAGPKSELIEVEWTGAVELHWFLERLQTRAEKGSALLEHRAKLVELFEAFQIENLAYFVPYQFPKFRQPAEVSKLPRSQRDDAAFLAEWEELAREKGSRAVAAIMAKRHGMLPRSARQARLRALRRIKKDA